MNYDREKKVPANKYEKYQGGLLVLPSEEQTKRTLRSKSSFPSSKIFTIKSESVGTYVARLRSPRR
jgi:hypothetical protein